MTVSQVGTPLLVTSATFSAARSGATQPFGQALAGSWNTDQPRTAGDLMVALVHVYGTVLSVLPDTPAGWDLIDAVQNSRDVIGIYTATATGGDTAPTFTGWSEGTTPPVGSSIDIEMREYHDSAGGTPVIYTTGRAIGTTANTLAVSTDAALVTGCAALVMFGVSNGSTAAVTTWTTPASWTATTSQTASRTCQVATYSIASPGAGVLTVTGTKSRTSTFTLGLVAAVGPAAGGSEIPLILDAAVSDVANASTSRSITFATEHASTAVLVGISRSIRTAPTGVTLDGTAMSLLGSALANGTDPGGSFLYGLANVASGSHTVVVAGASAGIETGIQAWAGADPVTPFGTAAGHTNTATGSTLALSLASTTAGNRIAAILSMGGALGTGAPAPGWQSMGIALNTSSAGGIGLMSVLNSPGGSWSGTFSVNVSSADDADGVAVEIKAAAGSTPVSSSDSAAVTEAVVRIALASSDSAAVTEAGSVTAAVHDSDSAAVAESQRLAVASSDAAAVTDTESLSGRPASSDAAVVTEQALVRVSDSDSAVVTELVSPLRFTGSDSAAVTELAAPFLVTGSDSAAVTELAAPFRFTGSDSAVVADLEQPPGRSFSDSDSAAVSEAVTRIALSSPDAAVVAESGSVIAAVSGSDSAVVTEGAPLIRVSDSDSAAVTEGQRLTLSSSDAAAVTELAPAVALAAADSAAVTEGTPSARVSDTDAAAVAEQARVSVSSSDVVAVTEAVLRIALADSDSAAVTEAQFLVFLITDSDSAAVTEAGSVAITVPVADSDSAVVTETESVSFATHITDSDVLAVVEASISFITDSDSAAVTEAVLPFRLRDSDSLVTDEVILSQRPHDSDSLRVTEAGFWSGGLSDADSLHVTERELPFPVRSSDAAAVTEADASTGLVGSIDVWAVSPPSHSAAGYYRVTYQAPDGREHVAYAAPRLEGAFFAAQRKFAILAAEGDIVPVRDSDFLAVTEAHVPLAELRVLVLAQAEVSEIEITSSALITLLISAEDS